MGGCKGRREKHGLASPQGVLETGPFGHTLVCMITREPFPPNHTAALGALKRFLPHAGGEYAARRNFDMGPGQHAGVSQLSPYIRHRVLTETDVLQAVLRRHSLSTAQKFVQEVFWRTYWKGWLELRPEVWTLYQRDVLRAVDDLQVQEGMRTQWEMACLGKTGIACFDAWAQELVETGYLHNHARMWFASIWVFTLRLPWVLGADLFLRHLLDGDPASNTLSWRWVAGLQTRGKTYLARPDNIAKFTGGRFRPADNVLAPEASALSGPAHPAYGAPPISTYFDPDKRTALILHEEDLNPGWLFDLGLRPEITATLAARKTASPLAVSVPVLEFRNRLLDDCSARWAARLGPITAHLETAPDIDRWAKDNGVEQIVAPYAPVGPVADTLNSVQEVPVLMPIRTYDQAAWVHSKAGFFKFRDAIPKLIGGLIGPPSP
jgi:deoxyribodipyrimidine photo-lyase